MSESDAYDLVFRLRWPDGVPICPHCGWHGAWRISARQKRADGRIDPRPLFKCKNDLKEEGAKRHQFSVTSGTMLHSRKLPLVDKLLQLYQFTRGAKGYAALAQQFQTGVSYKAAFVFEHKMRRVIAKAVQDVELEGDVEADLVFIGGYRRPRNNNPKRIKRLSPENKSKKKQALLALVERGGRKRYLTFPTRNESTASGLVQLHVAEGSRLFIDAAPGWTGFDGFYDVRVINHSERFSKVDPDGVVVTTNQAESYNSRLRRAEIGIHHRIAGRYHHDYAEEMGWRETVRRRTAREQFELLVGMCVAARLTIVGASIGA